MNIKKSKASRSCIVTEPSPAEDVREEKVSSFEAQVATSAASEQQLLPPRVELPQSSAESTQSNSCSQQEITVNHRRKEEEEFEDVKATGNQHVQKVRSKFIYNFRV